MMVGVNISDEQLGSIADRTIQEADTNGDNSISFNEFIKASLMVRGHLSPHIYNCLVYLFMLLCSLLSMVFHKKLLFFYFFWYFYCTFLALEAPVGHKLQPRSGHRIGKNIFQGNILHSTGGRTYILV